MGNTSGKARGEIFGAGASPSPRAPMMLMNSVSVLGTLMRKFWRKIGG